MALNFAAQPCIFAVCIPRIHHCSDPELYGFGIIDVCADRAIARLLKDDYASVHLVLFRNVIGVVFVLYWLYSKPPQQQGGRPWLLYSGALLGPWRCTFFLWGHYHWVAGVDYLSTVLSHFLALISSFWLGQRLNSAAWTAITVGFVGLCLIFVPKMSSHALEVKSHLIGIANLLMTGMVYLSIRGLTKYYDNCTIVLFYVVRHCISHSFDVAQHGLQGPDPWLYHSSTSGAPMGRFALILCLGIAALLGCGFSQTHFLIAIQDWLGRWVIPTLCFLIFLGSWLVMPCRIPPAWLALYSS